MKDHLSSVTRKKDQSFQKTIAGVSQPPFRFIACHLTDQMNLVTGNTSNFGNRPKPELGDSLFFRRTLVT